MVDLEEKQKYWREQLPKFEAKYWIPDHFSFLNFDMEQGNYVVKDGLDSIYEDDAIEIYHRVNTGWAMWKKCTSSMKAEINDLKAKLEAAQVPEGFVLVPKELTEEIINAMHDSFLGAFIEGKATGGQSIEFAYKAMIEAAQGEGHD